LLLAMIILYILTGRFNCEKSEIINAFLYGCFQVVISILELPGQILHLSYHIPNPIQITWDHQVNTLLWIVRIPRLVAALFVGGGLAVSGANYQATFRNPLVSESILGVSAGASLGACLGIFFNLGNTGISLLAFGGGILAVSLTYGISKMFRGNATLLLVLTGTVVSSMFSSWISLLKYIAPTDEMLSNITFWLMGSFATIGRKDLPPL
jgi:iron complex transport system permease protein